MLWRPIRPPSQGSAFGLRYGTWDIEIENRENPEREALIIKDLGHGNLVEYEFKGTTLFQAASKTWFQSSQESIDLCQAIERAFSEGQLSEAIPA